MAEPSPSSRRPDKLLILTVLFLVVTCVVPQRNSPPQNSPQSFEKQMLDKLINNNQQYDTFVRPTVKNTSEPIEVSIHVTVRNLEFLDILKNVSEGLSRAEFTVNMLISQEWEDSRLSYTQFNPPKKVRHLTVLDTSKIWKPDLYFTNEKLVDRSDAGKKEASFARVSPVGKVTLILRITATLSCPVNIRLFPFDSQKCPFKLASAAFTRDDIHLKWKNSALPIDVNPIFALMPGMAYHSVTSETFDIQTETGEVYSTLVGGFIFNRLKGHYWKQLYIPCTTLVFLGWLSFLLDATGIPGIVRAILVGATWTIAYLNISEFHHAMPKVAYSTAFDIWTGVCLAFIFVSVIAMILATYMANHGHTKTIAPERLQALEARKRLGEVSAHYVLQQKSSFLKSSFVVDRVLLFAYVSLFVLFGVAYFTVYIKYANISFQELKN